MRHETDAPYQSNLCHNEYLIALSSLQDKFADYKAKSPSGQFPTLVVDGETYVESGAILRYTGRVAGLYPTDPLEQLKQDQIIEMVQCLSDCNPLLNFNDCEGPEYKAKFDKFYQNTDGKLKQLETILTKAGTPYFGGKSPLAGDFHLWFLLDQVEVMKPGYISAYPKLETMFKTLLVDSKGLVKYLKSRPKITDVGFPGQNNLARKLTTNQYYKELES